jgi:hypothetical protein
MNFGAEFSLGKVEETGGGGHLDGEDGGILTGTRQHQLNNSLFTPKLSSPKVCSSQGCGSAFISSGSGSSILG